MEDSDKKSATIIERDSTFCREKSTRMDLHNERCTEQSWPCGCSDDVIFITEMKMAKVQDFIRKFKENSNVVNRGMPDILSVESFQN